MIRCSKCGIELIIGINWTNGSKNHHTNICKACANKQSTVWRNENREHVRTVENARRYRLHQRTPMKENKECSSYLGVYVAERTLKHLFKDVEVMPYGYKGYDFICNKGKKIDVKSACMKVGKGNRSNSFDFNIKCNKICDYFLCLAFDNRDDLNPLHMWLLPSTKIHHLINASISISTINKWNEYKLDIDKVAECCNVMKGDD